MAHRWFSKTHSIIGILAGVCCIAECSNESPRAIAPTLDGMTVSQHTFVAEPGANFRALASMEIPISDRRAGADGSNIITAYMTDVTAHQIAAFGFREKYPNGSRLQDVPGPSPLLSCPHWPASDCRFALWDTQAGECAAGGVYTQIHALAGPAVQVIDLVTTSGGRPLPAVFFGLHGTTTNLAPTVYIAATHHAREWVAEQVGLQLAQWVAGDRE